MPPDDQEEYDTSPEQAFQDVTTSPLSTFASDVDTASYSNLRRQLRQGVAPEGVRIEELVNYFDYDYPTRNLVRPTRSPSPHRSRTRRGRPTTSWR